MTAKEVLEALKKHHGDNGKEWAFFAELRAGTGYGQYKKKLEGVNPEQRLDAWAVNLWPSKNLLRRCYEIKVSRSDFLHEIKNPLKRQQGLSLSNEFYFAVPYGLVTVEEIPEETGLMVVFEDGKCAALKRAPYREVEPPPISLFTSIARRAAYNERG